MKIIAHRGFWKKPEEKNTKLAFERAFSNGFGVETDLRDWGSEIVISHDRPLGREMRLQDFLELTSQYSAVELLIVALNIKSNGLAQDVISATKNYTNLDCFVFDMAIPDMRWYLGSQLSVYTRVSDVEVMPVYESEVKGIWLDSFCDPVWYCEKRLAGLLEKKKVCLVSPELHGFDPTPVWHMICSVVGMKNLILCTDWPDKAKHYFGV